MEPDRQLEIQLGHMCNNRCVFCVSGQRTADKEAGPVPAGPILAELRRARAIGHRKITLLGGEPTLQPAFLEIVREAVALGFEEIVLFTNGAKTARAELIDQILATGGAFTWRISIQGATRESHERTTQKPGSFARILRTLEHLRAREQRVTVNMCVVTSNHEDVDRFPELLAPYGVRQLHLDLMRPLDAGRRTEEELRAAMPPYSALADPMRRMIRGFPDGFDVNIGNLPYCVAPDLARWIHHDGEPTETIAIDGRDELSAPWDKYLVKRRDKRKPPACAGCVMRDRCSGVFETYLRFHGAAELTPISREALRAADPEGRLLSRWLDLDALAGWSGTALGDDRLALSHGALQLELDRDPRDALARYGRLCVHHRGGRASAGALVQLARALAAIAPPIHPLGTELAEPPHAAIGAALARLRARAPFADLAWTAIDVGAARAAITLRAPEGSAAELWIGLEDGRPRGGYRVDGDAAALVEGLRAALEALRSLRI